MSPSVVCYAERKKKSQLVLEAFAAGCGGRMASTTASELEPGPAAFYGVRPGWNHLWQQAKREGRDWYYLDNAYHDCAREQQFRVTKNAIQHTGQGESDGTRFKALGITVKPMRDGGYYVLVCEQSAEFMQTVAGDPEFYQRVIANLVSAGRSVVIRSKGETRPLLQDLERASALVTWSSAAAVTALLEGVRVMCAPECCATYANDREMWASVLSDNQFSLEEMSSGAAWRQLNAQ